MEYISSAGIACLARHGLNIDQMIDRWKQGFPIIFGPNFLDHDLDPDAAYGKISFQRDLWRVYQRCGRFKYWELGSRRAKLRIEVAQLPETVLASIKKSTPLDAIVHVPQECIAGEARAEFMGIINQRGNSVEMLLRIAWYPITKAYMLERF